MIEKILNWSELSRYITDGGDRNNLRFGKRIPKKHVKELDRLFNERLPEWWKDYKASLE
jgi:hypothetical protein